MRRTKRRAKIRYDRYIRSAAWAQHPFEKSQDKNFSLLEISRDQRLAREEAEQKSVWWET